jgi:hypothetical protein
MRLRLAAVFWAENPRVDGSIPPLGTISKIKNCRLSAGFFMPTDFPDKPG